MTALFVIGSVMVAAGLAGGTALAAVLGAGARRRREARDAWGEQGAGRS